MGLTACASLDMGSEATSYWSARSLANAPTPLVNLQNPNNTKTLGVVGRARMKRVVDVMDKVAQVSGSIRPVFLVVSGESPNAFAWYENEKSYIAVNLGMLGIIGEYPDKAAAVLSHELAHLYEKHGENRVVREGYKQIINLAIGTILASHGVRGADDVVNLITTMIVNTYTREEEKDADIIGVNYMKLAGYDLNGAVSMHEHLDEMSNGLYIPYLASHPSGKERIAYLKVLAANK